MDRIIEHADGFDIIVGGERHGTWRSRAEAQAGMQVEIRRQRAKIRDANRARYGNAQARPSQDNPCVDFAGIEAARRDA